MKSVGIIGKPLCAALYGFFAYLAAKKKPLPLILLFIMHTTEYFIIGKKTGEEYGISKSKSLINCLSFGFTWWLPVRKGDKDRLLEIADISKTSVCPLARVMRRELKKCGITSLDVVYSKEEPISDGKRLPASSSFVPPAAGFIAASFVVRKLLDLD